MTILTPSNALPGIPFPNHLSGKNKPQSYLYPGAVQVKGTGPTVLSYTNALLGIPFPQHSSGKTNTVQSFLYPGAVQPIVPASSPSIPAGFGGFPGAGGIIRRPRVIMG